MFEGLLSSEFMTDRNLLSNEYMTEIFKLKFLTKNSVLLSWCSGVYFNKSLKVAGTYLKSEIVQNEALKGSHLLTNFVINELLHKYLL